MHEFALYHDVVATWPPDVSGSECIIQDRTLVHRFRKVLRLSPGESCILFDTKHWARVVLVAYSDGAVTVRVSSYEPIVPLQPRIDLYLPLLERSAYEMAVSAAAVLGVTKIVPLVTAKTKRTSCSPSELERLRRIMVAAAEQSKQFALPEIAAVMSYEEALRSADDLIAFDINGTPASQDVARLQAAKHLSLIIGPEGDFTEQERALLDARGVIRYRLTPSILRSEDAVMVGVGLLRCLTYVG